MWVSFDGDSQHQPDGTVKMTVEPEVPLTSDTLSGKDVKSIISQRTARTTVSVQSGQSVLIGGLISTKVDSDKEVSGLEYPSPSCFVIRPMKTVKSS